MSDFLRTLVSRERPAALAKKHTLGSSVDFIAPRVAAIFEPNIATRDGGIHHIDDDKPAARTSFDEEIFRNANESNSRHPSSDERSLDDVHADVHNVAVAASRERANVVSRRESQAFAHDENRDDTQPSPEQSAHGQNQLQTKNASVRMRSEAVPAPDVYEALRFRVDAETRDETTEAALTNRTKSNSRSREEAKALSVLQIRVAHADQNDVASRRGRANTMLPQPSPPARGEEVNRRDAHLLVSPSNAERTINITIGRVEVRATEASASRPGIKAPAGPRPMGLDEYLAARNKRGP